MKSETLLDHDPLSLSPDREQACIQLLTSTMYQHILALEARSSGLQALVCELLHTNQELRTELAVLRARNKPELTAMATHPRQHPDH